MGYANSMSAEALNDKIAAKVHDELTRLMCTKAAYQNLVPELATKQTSSHLDVKDTLPKIETPTPEVNQALTTQSTKQMIKEALNNALYKNMHSTKQQKQQDQSSTESSKKIEKHVP